MRKWGRFQSAYPNAQNKLEAFVGHEVPATPASMSESVGNLNDFGKSNVEVHNSVEI